MHTQNIITIYFDEDRNRSEHIASIVHTTTLKLKNTNPRVFPVFYFLRVFPVLPMDVLHYFFCRYDHLLHLLRLFTSFDCASEARWPLSVLSVWLSW